VRGCANAMARTIGKVLKRDGQVTGGSDRGLRVESRLPNYGWAAFGSASAVGHMRTAVDVAIGGSARALQHSPPCEPSRWRSPSRIVPHSVPRARSVGSSGPMARSAKRDAVDQSEWRTSLCRLHFPKRTANCQKRFQYATSVRTRLTRASGGPVSAGSLFQKHLRCGGEGLSKKVGFFNAPSLGSAAGLGR